MAQRFKEGSPERKAQLIFQQAGNEDKQTLYCTPATGRMFWDAGAARRFGEGEPMVLRRSDILSLEPAAEGTNNEGTNNEDGKNDTPQELTAEQIDALKAEYEQLAGKAPGHNWKPTTLEAKVKELQVKAAEEAQALADAIAKEIEEMTADTLPKVSDLKQDTLAFVKRYGIEHTAEDTEQELCEKAAEWFKALEK